MKRIIAITFVAALGGASVALAQNEVDIVYPVDGGTYPIMDPTPGSLSSAYITSGFRATCPGGPHRIEWGFGGPTPFMSLGNASFYDQLSAHFIHKLPGGAHYFEVKSECGSDAVKFKVGN